MVGKKLLQQEQKKKTKKRDVGKKDSLTQNKNKHKGKKPTPKHWGKNTRHSPESELSFEKALDCSLIQRDEHETLVMMQ